MASEIKKLTINNIVYAEYIIKNGTIYLEMIRPIIEGNDRVSESILMAIVQSMDDDKFERADYLNN